MKKVTIITMQLHTPGGIERFVSTLSIMLSVKYKVELVVNYGKETQYISFPIPKNVKLTFLQSKQPQEISMKQIIMSFKWNKVIPEIKRRITINKSREKTFSNYLSTLDTDYIITDRALYNSIVSKCYQGKAKKIATDHNYHQNDKRYIKKLLNSIAQFDALVVATKELQADYAPLTSTKCLYIPNPLPSIPTKKAKLNTHNLISVGRLVPEKDFPLLIEAMNIVHQKNPLVHLTIIGDGVEKNHINNLIRQYKLKNAITLTGFLPQEQIANYYYDSSLFVMTSKTEAFGLVLTEAMSYGLPCLALKRASGPRNQIKKDTGILLDSSDPEDIANTIIEALGNKTILQKYQRNISQEISKYSIDSISESWYKLLSLL